MAQLFKLKTRYCIKNKYHYTYTRTRTLMQAYTTVRVIIVWGIPKMVFYTFITFQLSQKIPTIHVLHVYSITEKKSINRCCMELDII